MGYAYFNDIFRLSWAMVAALATALPLNAQLITQSFYFTGGLQTFTVPLNCIPSITIEAIGAGGGSVTNVCPADGGLGASMRGTFCGTTGDVFYIRVGQVGQSNGSDGGGGGGSFVVSSGTVPLVVAGGGGGATNNVTNCGANRNGMHASITTSGTPGANGLGTGGTAGGGGGTPTLGMSGSGAGFYTNGTGNGSGKAYVNGGGGGTGLNDNGGYGGGGSGWWTGGNGGGGGGYSGGGTSGSLPYTGGGGGGSYNSGINQVNTAAVQAGHGVVNITYSLGTPVPYTISPANICSGQPCTITASSMVSYTWNTSSHASSIDVNPTGTAQYTVKATDPMGCIALSVITVTVNALPQITAVTTPTALCPGNTASVTAAGANSFTWSTGVYTHSITASPAGSKSFTVSGTGNNGCVDSVIAVINMNTITLQVTGDTSVCMGHSIVLSASGALTYTWNNQWPFPMYSVSPAIDSTFTVSAMDVNSCLHTANMLVTVKPVPNIDANAHTTSICKGEPVKLRAWGAVHYEWSTGHKDSVIEIIPPLDFTYNFTVTGTDTNGCYSLANVVVKVNSCVGLQEPDQHPDDLNVYPNPGNGLYSLTFSGNPGHKKISVFNSLGMLVKEQEMNAETKIDIRDANKGVYFLYITENERPVMFSRLIKE